MNKFSIIVFTIFIIISCNSNQENQLASEATEIKEDSTSGHDEPSEGQSLEEIIKAFTDEYTKKEKYDSTFFIGTDLYKIEFEHYCLFDSGIVVDKPFVGIYKLDSFVTHNFATRFTVTKNGESPITRYITRDNFKGKVDSLYTSEGALLYPNFHVSEGAFFFTYSLSVPLTDVGIPVGCKIDLNGDMEFYPLH